MYCVFWFRFLFVTNKKKPPNTHNKSSRLSVSRDGCPELEIEIRIGDMKPTGLQ